MIARDQIKLKLKIVRWSQTNSKTYMIWLENSKTGIFWPFRSSHNSNTWALVMELKEEKIAM